MNTGVKQAFARMRLLVRQAVLRGTDDSGDVQKVTVELIGGEKAEGIPRQQSYGLSSHLPEDIGHALVLTINGRKVAIALDEPGRRPRGLEAGEVILYSREDIDGDQGDGRAGSHHRIHFKKDRITHHKCGEYCEIEQSPDHVRMTHSEGAGTEVLLDKDQVRLVAGASEIRLTDAGIEITAPGVDFYEAG